MQSPDRDKQMPMPIADAPQRLRAQLSVRMRAVWVRAAAVALVGALAAFGMQWRGNFSGGLSAGKAQPTTLNLWYLTSGVSTSSYEEKRYVDEFLRRYETLHPDVRVNATYYSHREYLRALGNALAGLGAFPDLACSDQGGASVGEVIARGQLVDLTETAQKYGWRQRLRPGMLEYLALRYPGRTWLIPSRIHYTGVFYNRQIFERLKLKPPATQEEFETLLERLKAEHYTPFALSGPRMIHYWFALANNALPLLPFKPKEVTDSFIAGRPLVPFNAAPFVSATEKLREWVSRGYFPPHYETIGDEEDHDAFLDGTYPLYFGLTGPWTHERAINHPPRFMIGFFPFPPSEQTGGQTPIATGAPHGVWQVFKNARQQQSVELIDFMLSPEMSQAMIAHHRLPAMRAEFWQHLPLAPYVAEEVAGLGQVELGGFYDNAFPTLRPTIHRGLQQALQGKITAAQFADRIEQAFQCNAPGRVPAQALPSPDAR